MNLTTNAVPPSGKIEFVPIRRLMLDEENPRLADFGAGKSQEDLAVHLEMGFDAFTVAESIAKFGYFNSEPLVAVPKAGSDVLIVVEGNRRLTAILGLAVPDIRRAYFDADRWERLRPISPWSADTIIPVVVVASRDECRPLLGYRHISGILQWTPFAQARYIAGLFAEGKTLEEIRAQVGLEPAKVAGLNRDFAIAMQAKRLGIDTGAIESTFSLLQVAMGNTKLRDCVGAPLGSQYAHGSDPIPCAREDSLREVLGYIFGTETREPVIQDSRQISKLGLVVAAEEGLRALRNGESLEAAKQLVEDQQVDPKDRLVRRLTAARNALAAAGGDMPQFYDDISVMALVEEIGEALRSLEGPSA
jgi:hypothetical protein